MKWPTDIDSMLRGTKDLRRQSDADKWLEGLWRARVKRHAKSNVIQFRSRRSAAFHDYVRANEVKS